MNWGLTLMVFLHKKISSKPSHTLNILNDIFKVLFQSSREKELFFGQGEAEGIFSTRESNRRNAGDLSRIAWTKVYQT